VRCLFFSLSLSCLLMDIDSPVGPLDTWLVHYLIVMWVKVHQVMGADFEPYVLAVMPMLLTMDSAKLNVLVYGVRSFWY